MDKKESIAFIKAAAMALFRIRYGADNVDFIDDEASGLVYKIGDEVKYVTLQAFDYEDRGFHCNDDTFSGEDNVMQFTPYSIRMFKVSKIKPLLAENRKLAKKLPNGDIRIPFDVVRKNVKEVLFEHDDK